MVLLVSLATPLQLEECVAVVAVEINVIIAHIYNEKWQHERSKFIYFIMSKDISSRGPRVLFNFT
jgi:hypothetical protein